MPVYEMCWDCPRCDSKGLLGKTHRHCPSCGAPQDPERRYFPPESERVAVEDHVFVGRDLVCAHCEAPSSAAAKHCAGCGAAIGDDDGAVALVGADEPAPAPPPRRRGRAGCILALLALAALAAATLVCGVGTWFWTRDATLVVTGHSWERKIEVEELRADRDGTWCDTLPSDAYGVSRSRKERSTDRIPDGETCSEVQRDNGDGTFTTSTECETRYREEPVYDDWCDYTVDRWKRAYDAEASGNARTPAPHWPSVSTTGCARLGCTREGGRSEEYRVILADEGRDGWSSWCALSERAWAEVEVDKRFRAKVGVLDGSPRCDSLEGI